MSTYIVGVTASLATLVFVVELLRRGILREKFAVLWLLVTFTLTVVAIFPKILFFVASLLGVEVPANLLFVLGGLILLLVSVQLSFEVSRLDLRTRRLGEDLALLNEQVRILGEHKGDSR